MKHKLPRVTREQFDHACEALWSEMEYINDLPRRTDDEAQDVPGFLTLARHYLRKTEADWADNAGTEVWSDAVNGKGDPCVRCKIQVPEALGGLRKTATILLRAMIFNGVLKR